MSMFKSIVACAILALAVQAQTKQCKQNEEFRSCGTACEPACSKPQSNFCTLQCIVDVCQCKSGYSRDDSGNCIRTSECPQNAPPGNGSCGVGEYFNECGGCDSTCQNRNVACITICGPGACRCNNGLVRNASGRCVSPSQCPGNARPYRSVNSCETTVCKADETCQLKRVFCFQPPCHPQPFCAKNEINPLCASVSCLIGSQCVVRSNQPVCVPNAGQNNTDHLAHPCTTHTCNVGEKCVEQQVQCVMAPCYPVAECVPTKYDDDQSPCYTVRCGFNTECKAINGSARCIPRGSDIIGQEVCPVNQTFVQCSSPCPTTCTNRGQMACIKSCGPPACSCSQGYYLTDSLECVLLKDCPNSNSTTSNNLTCATVKCAGGNTCEIMNGKPTCTPSKPIVARDTPVLTCASVSCATGYACEFVSGSPLCMPINATSNSTLTPISNFTSNSTITTTTTSVLTCATVKCAGDHVCEIVNGRPFCMPSNSTFFPVSNSTSFPNVNSTSNSTVLTTRAPLQPCVLSECPRGQVCRALAGGRFCTPNTSIVESNSTRIPPSNLNSTVLKTTTPIALTCATVMCVGGHRCEMVNGRPRCTPSNRNESACNLVDCRSGYVCRIIRNEPQCTPSNSTELPAECAAMQCPIGAECKRNGNGTVGCVQQDHRRNETNCSKNEMFSSSGGCEPTCAEPFKTCANSTISACVCAGGFVRQGKRCVPYALCDDFSVRITGNETCSNTEVYSENKKACEPTCHGNELCKLQHDTAVVKGCVCRPFYKRNDRGHCVHQRFCYKTAGCKVNESWSSCLECEDKCDEKNSKCGTSCTSGCACDAGFSRNSNATCVLEQMC